MNTTTATKYPEWTHPLYLQASSDPAARHDLSVVTARLQLIVDRQAECAARARASWHDDPEGDPEGHAAAHAPASEMFPPSVRAAVALELVEYYLTGSQGIEGMEDPAPACPGFVPLVNESGSYRGTCCCNCGEKEENHEPATPSPAQPAGNV